jgi:hypothetical protein
VAHRVGLSTAHLHRLYAVEPYSASKYLWRRRLVIFRHKGASCFRHIGASCKRSN